MPTHFSALGKVLVVGFDAATWHVIDPLIAGGRMPHLAELKARGTSGVLRSMDYSASPVMWTTIATGKSPARHGLHDFYAGQSQLRAKRLWEILADEGATVGIYQWLVTWPPRPLNGFVVPGWLSPDPATHPRELEFITRFKSDEQKGKSSLAGTLGFGWRAIRYGLTPRTAIRAGAFLLGRLLRRPSRLDKYRAQLLDISLSTDFFRSLCRRHDPDFAAIVFYQADATGHAYWKYRQPERFAEVSPEEAHRYGDVIDRVYARLDEALGQLLRGIDSGWTVLVISDHGMGPAITPNGWAYRPRLDVLLDRWGVLPEGTHSTIGLDFYVRLMGSTPLARDYQRERLEQLIQLIVLESLGEPLFATEPTDEGYVKIRLRFASPSLKGQIVRLPDGSTCLYEDMVAMDERMTGAHERDGMFVLAGPGVVAGQWLGPVELIDICPTLLALMGHPVAGDMEGRVLTGALRPEFLRDHPVRHIESYEAGAVEPPPLAEVFTQAQRAEVEARLKALGYLD